MRTMTLTSKAATLGGVVLFLVGCHQTSDGYDNRWLLEADTPAVDFGTVTLPDTSPVHTITLRNTGRKTVRLAAVSGESLRVDAPIFELASSVSTCSTGALLGPGDSCTLAVTFAPDRNTAFTNTIQVAWRSVRDDADREESFTRTLQLRGQGEVDCQADGTWWEAYGQGKDEALAKNVADYDRGYAAGQAKDFDDGFRGAYDQAYRPAYESAYQDAYDRAYGNFYDEGYDEGWSVHADTYRACQAGRADGWADGSHLGDQEGSVDGHDDGLYDGTFDANAGAWDRLASAERWGGVYAACEESYGYFFGATARASAQPPPSSTGEEIAGMCEDKGFSEHRDLSAQDDGYADGLRDNDDYQSGRRQGASEGRSEGEVDGTRSGTRDGRQDGFEDGAVDGKVDAEQLAYDDCYDATYPAAHAEAYELAYLDAYWAAYDLAYADEYYAVMDDYYSDADCDVVLFGS